jgi:hypothetical protein
MRTSILARLLGVAAIATFLSGPATARADGEGYIDNFAGGIRFTRAGTTFINYPAALKTQLDTFWGTARPAICTYVWQQLNANGYAMPSQQDNFTCSFPASGEMRAKALTPDRVGVKYILHGAKIQSWHYPANPKLAPASATYSATFDMEIGLEIDVSHTPFTIVGAKRGAVVPGGSPILQAQPSAHGAIANLGQFLDTAVTAGHFYDSWKHQFEILSGIVLQAPANKPYPVISLGIIGGNQVLVALNHGGAR